jgi:hypothetical protein
LPDNAQSATRGKVKRRGRSVLKSWLKRAAYFAAPGLAAEFFAARERAHSHREAQRWGIAKVNDYLFQNFGDRVLSGPFKGLVLPPITRAEAIGPCLIGTYEHELHDCWEMIFSARFPQVLDVGAKVGYYAVGLALRFPESRVFAFDVDPWARRAVAEMVAANHVSNVEIRSACKPEWLARHLASESLILSDCEGFEGELLCSVAIPNLATATLVIETHDARVPGVTARIRSLLRSTHSVAEVRDADGPDRSVPDIDLSGLTEGERGLAIREVRSPQSWLVCLPLSGSNSYLRDQVAERGLKAKNA